jgi:formate hydrogenlyase subunit 6/NADH:ubiquinone oxidoreductase subunit I
MLREVVSQLFNKPATQAYPFVKPVVPEGLRGRQIFYIDRCISCGLCAKECPSNAIEMVDVEGYEKKKPLFMLDRCVFCYQCAESCPKNAISTSTFFELAGFSKSDLTVKPIDGVRGMVETKATPTAETTPTEETPND